MRTGRPIPTLSLADDERETLKQWARRPKTSQAVAQRARIILACADGETNTTVAERLRVTKQMVGKWRSRRRIHSGSGKSRLHQQAADPGAASISARRWKPASDAGVDLQAGRACELRPAEQ